MSKKTRQVQVGSVRIGGGAPVSVQSMTNTDTADVEKTLSQIRALTVAGADIVRHGEGADPAAVVFDSISAAKARGSDVIIVDTAGRLHNKANLMNELAKIDRVISRELPDASRETLLVLDATTGQNAVHQAEEFNKAAELTGIILTKLDGTAKGGIVIAISAGLGVPVKLVGVGEGIDDLIDFDRAAFLEAILPPAEQMTGSTDSEEGADEE